MKRHLLSALLLLFGCRAALAQCTADAGPNQALTCAVSIVQLQGSSNIPAATYAWSGPNGFTSNQQTPTVLYPGMYTLTITDPSDGCTSTAVAVVTQDIVAPGVSVTGGTLSCATPIVTVTATSFTPNVSYAWTGPGGFTSTMQNPTVSSPGIYPVVVTAPNGCTSTAVAVVYQEPTLFITPTTQPIFCNGQADGEI